MIQEIKEDSKEIEMIGLNFNLCEMKSEIINFLDICNLSNFLK